MQYKAVATIKVCSVALLILFKTLFILKWILKKAFNHF
jgi:hypothetical protein